MITKSLQEAIYLYIFPPDGSIPFKAKANIPSIDARIWEIEQLAKGEPLLGENRRLNKKESLILTDQIIQLRDSCSPRMNFKEIMRRLGNVVSPEAARNRYDDAKKAREAAAMQKEGYDAISGEAVLAGTYRTLPEVQSKIDSGDQFVESDKMIPNACDDSGNPVCLRVSGGAAPGEKIETVILPAAQPELPDAKPKDNDRPYIDRSDATPKNLTEPNLLEQATIRNSRIVQESEKVDPEDAALRNAANLSPSQAAHIWGPKIPHGEDEYILTERTAGKKFSEIRDALRKKGIACHDEDVSTRYYVEKRKQEDAQKRTSVPHNVSPAQPDATPGPSLPGVEGAQDAARAHPRGTPEEEPHAKPNPKLDYMEVADSKIISMKKSGLLNQEIAQALERNPGGSWTCQKVDARWTQLKREGLA